jgi:YggT family protein
MVLLAAITRDGIANYVGILFDVYIALIFIYLLANIAFSFGLRPPYSRSLDVVMGFLRDVSEPYLKIFRRFIPQIGMFDFSPWVAIIVLYVLDSVITSLISG